MHTVCDRLYWNQAVIRDHLIQNHKLEICFIENEYAYNFWRGNFLTRISILKPRPTMVYKVVKTCILSLYGM